MRSSHSCILVAPLFRKIRTEYCSALRCAAVCCDVLRYVADTRLSENRIFVAPLLRKIRTGCGIVCVWAMACLHGESRREWVVGVISHTFYDLKDLYHK